MAFKGDLPMQLQVRTQRGRSLSQRVAGWGLMSDLGVPFLLRVPQLCHFQSWVFCHRLRGL